jgi:lactate dehydrogenase-like 2-hydroxyacid dehydrogenase
MGSIQNTPLDGHKVLILMGTDPDDMFITRLQHKFPSLKVHWHNTTTKIPPELYKDTTVICTWDTLPTQEQAPRLELVQLTSAGSNHCWESELYANPKIKFCTANGVHP